jgi:hypothetical protein
MDGASQDGRSSSQKTPEQIRAERIAATADPKLRQELDGIAKARDAELAREREKQQQNYDKRVAELREQKIRNANAPQLRPPGVRSPYQGDGGYERAESDAKAKIQSDDRQYLKNRAKEYNDQIDQRLDAQRENQAGRDPSVLRTPGAEQERGTVTTFRPRAQDRAAELIEKQNYAERARQAELERQKQQELARQQQRQRGLER